MNATATKAISLPFLLVVALTLGSHVRMTMDIFCVDGSRDHTIRFMKASMNPPSITPLESSVIFPL